jgi:hypothetical protein
LLCHAVSPAPLLHWSIPLFLLGDALFSSKKGALEFFVVAKRTSAFMENMCPSIRPFMLSAPAKIESP